MPVVNIVHYFPVAFSTGLPCRIQFERLLDPHKCTRAPDADGRKEGSHGQGKQCGDYE